MEGGAPAATDRRPDERRLHRRGGAARRGSADRPFSEKRINSDDVWNLIDRTETRHEKAYDQLPVDDRLTTRVRLTFKDDSTRDKVVAHPRGTGNRVLTDADIVDKYRSLTRSVITTDRQTAIEKAVLNLDALDDISELMALLIPTVASALDGGLKEPSSARSGG